MDFHVPQTKTRSLGKSRIAPKTKTAIPGHDLHTTCNAIQPRQCLNHSRL
jgi:hypothetical protein